MKKVFSKQNILLLFLLALALFVRVYRIDQNLGFYFDQGRDALVIWNLIHQGKFFLIGPTTGIEGIFRGPWYYWLITPFYFLGKGNPVWPSIWLSFTTTIAIGFVFLLAKAIGGKISGLVAVVISSFSFYLVYASRWLSNPTPMLLISVALVWAMYKSLKRNIWTWPLIGLLAGQAMQFGSAAEVFYLPAILVFAIWQRKNLPNWKILFSSFLLFLLAFIPQIIFDLKHNQVLSKQIIKFLFDKNSFKLSFWEVIKTRLPFYYSVFASKIWPGQEKYTNLFLVFGLIITCLNFKKLWSISLFRIVLLLFISPLIGMFFFQGNYGNIYDYYFTGYYLIFAILFSVSFGLIWRNPIGKLALLLFLYFFISFNFPVLKSYIVSGVDGPTTILFGNQKQAIDWIYNDSHASEFNSDVYVPPVIPYAYDYLFKWYPTSSRFAGLRGTNGKLVENQVPLLYTLYEVDPPHPERLEAWLNRQKSIGEVVREAKFGGITVQRRTRL